jgi:hypothetical protein
MYDMEQKERVYPSLSFAKKPFSIRWFLQYLGTDVMRTHLSDDIWVDTVLKEVRDTLRENPEAKICISDCRFLNEVERFRCLPGTTCTSLRIHRPSLHKYNTYSGMHVSELQDFEVDHDLYNGSTLEELYFLVKDSLSLA